MNELCNYTQVWCLSVRPEPFWVEAHIPYGLCGRQFSKSEDIGPEDAMAVGLALKQDMDAIGMFRRVGVVRCVKTPLFLVTIPSVFTLI